MISWGPNKRTPSDLARTAQECAETKQDANNNSSNNSSNNNNSNNSSNNNNNNNRKEIPWYPDFNERLVILQLVICLSKDFSYSNQPLSDAMIYLLRVRNGRSFQQRISSWSFTQPEIIRQFRQLEVFFGKIPHYYTKPPTGGKGELKLWGSDCVSYSFVSSPLQVKRYYNSHVATKCPNTWICLHVPVNLLCGWQYSDHFIPAMFESKASLTSTSDSPYMSHKHIEVSS